ncbi:MAG TPA: ABC transporter permease [Paenirhodobacter sp.]
MLIFILKRLGLALLVTIAAMCSMIIMLHMVPGDPVRTMLGPRATPALQEALTARMGLDQPLPVQIWIFFRNLLHGDLGTDVFENRPVLTIVLEQLPYTLELILASISWAIVLGVILGVAAAVRPNGLFDRAAGVLSVSVIAAPAFVVSLLSLLCFSVWLGWFPAIGAGGAQFVDRLPYLVLPAFSIGLSWVGYLARLVRASMLEILAQPHVRTAQAFGLSPWRIHYVYALKLAIPPVITTLGVGMGFLLSASVFTEMVFARPGLGRLVVDSITNRNYPVVMGAVLASTVLFVVSTALADILNALFDPRVRRGR